MALTINDRDMTSDQTPHAARPAPGGEHQWEVSWLPGRRLTRNEAITDMALPDKQPTGDSDHAEQGTRTNSWFHRTASRPALRTRATPPPAPADDHASGSRRGRPAAPSARPSPMSKEERASLRDGTHPLSLT